MWPNRIWSPPFTWRGVPCVKRFSLSQVPLALPRSSRVNPLAVATILAWLRDTPSMWPLYFDKSTVGCGSPGALRPKRISGWMGMMTGSA